MDSNSQVSTPTEGERDPVPELTAQEKLTIAEHSSTALFHFLKNCSVTLFDTTPVNGRHEISSGTVVDIEGRLFIATAAHCIPTNPEGRLWILPDHPKKPEDGMLGFLSIGRHPQLDVGYLEVTPQAMKGYLPKTTQIPLSSIQCLNQGRTKTLVTLMGYPEQFIDVHEFKGLPAYAAKLMGLSTTIIEPQSWPVPPETERSADESCDVFLEYPTSARRWDTGEDIPLSTPKGFSGGGLWDHGFCTTKMWTPESHAMFAIQSSWGESQRYVRAIQIIHWLNLLRSKVKELRTHLEKQFPVLLTLQLI